MASLEPVSAVENITELTHKLVQGITIQATLQLYIQVAFIVPVFSFSNVQCSVSSASSRSSIHGSLKTLSGGRATIRSRRIVSLYNFYYQEDIKVYGDPANTEHQTVEFNESATSWQAVRKKSKKVLPNPKN
ncbi:hypothetical protein B0H13DRAFT_1909491 [Mycena leptocephala]|nr:hypothetical protein B0H13DRAFT_1909491 [Mycena leptocephala]